MLRTVAEVQKVPLGERWKGVRGLFSVMRSPGVIVAVAEVAFVIST